VAATRWSSKVWHNKVKERGEVWAACWAKDGWQREALTDESSDDGGVGVEKMRRGKGNW
jgi:hypothetical protein